MATVTVWNNDDTTSWSRETFEDVPGHADKVRTRLDWFVGSGPGRPDMVLDNSWTSEPEPGGTMTDRHTFTGSAGAGLPAELDRGSAPVYLGDQLAGYERAGTTTVVT